VQQGRLAQLGRVFMPRIPQILPRIGGGGKRIPLRMALIVDNADSLEDAG